MNLLFGGDAEAMIDARVKAAMAADIGGGRPFPEE